MLHTAGAQSRQTSDESTSVMGFLNGKKLLITGALTSNSIAYGIAQACAREGATLAFTYQSEALAPRVKKLAALFQSDLCFPCDVTDDRQIDQVFSLLHDAWGELDGLVHSLAFAPQESVSGDYLDGLSRDAFRQAQEVSCYSFSALAKAAFQLMESGRGALLTLSYIGATRYVPTYNTMGLAKASLEASVRYLANSLGKYGIRANSISAAPIRTTAAMGVSAFEEILAHQERVAPLAHEVTVQDVGNAAAFLLSDLAASITGQNIFVDGGLSSTSGFLLGDR
jgi:enoyl-[acyl-carrier protein] reductase I